MTWAKRMTWAKTAPRFVVGLVVTALLVAPSCGSPTPGGLGRPAGSTPSHDPAGGDIAVAPGRDVAAALREQDDGSARPGRRVARTELPFEFRRNGYRVHPLPQRQLPQGPAVFAARKDTDTHDAHGVRMREIDGKLYDHPNYQANYGLENLESYRRTGDRFYLDRAVAQAERLVDRRVESRGAWFYPYLFDFRLFGNVHETVRAPWYSGLSQGKALSLFSRLAQVTGERRWREAADRTFASFLDPPDRAAPWVVAVDGDGLVRFVQHPLRSPQRSDLIFNGHLAATFAVGEYYQLSGNATALALFDGGVTTMARHLSDLRIPGWRSRYSLLHPAYGSNTYHRLHSNQFVQLWLLTRRSEFVRMADALRDDNPWPVLETERTIAFAAGSHVGYEFDLATGKVLDQAEEDLDEPTTGTTIRRMRMKGRGIYYRVASGPLGNLWVPEQPGLATIRGPVAVLDYRAGRRGTFAPGHDYIGHRYDAAGRVTGTKRVRFQTGRADALDQSAWIDGVRAGHVTTGPLAGYWVATARVAFE